MLYSRLESQADAILDRDMGNGMDIVTIIIVDDHPLFRQGVADLVALEEDLRVVGQASSGDEAMRLIRQLRPAVAILDVNLPGLNGQQVVRQVAAERLPTRVILVTAYDDMEQMIRAMRGGAYAYCAKSVEPERLLWVVRQVAQGKYVLGDEAVERARLERWLDGWLESAARPRSEADVIFSPLSEREMEVLTCITRGMSNKEIAAALRISHQTVKNHVTSILRKIGVEDRTQAAIYALRQGWVRLYHHTGQKEE